MSKSIDKSDRSRAPSSYEAERNRSRSAELAARWNGQTPDPASSRRTDPPPATSAAVKSEAAEVSGFLSRLAASLNEPYMPYSGATGTKINVAAKDGAYVSKQGHGRSPNLLNDYSGLRYNRGNEASVRTTDSSETVGLINNADLLNTNTFSAKSMKFSHSGSERGRPKKSSSEDKHERLKSSHSSTSSHSSGSVLVQRQSKGRHHERRNHADYQYGRDTPATRSSSRDHKIRTQDERNNNATRSRHSSREMVKFDSNSNVKLRGSPKSSEHPSRHASQIRSSKPSSRHSSLGWHSREMLTLPVEMSKSVGDMDAFRQYSGSLGPGSGESTIGLEPQPPKPIGIPFKLAIHRRTTALSMAIMTLALLSGSASQLRFMMAYATAHQYPELNYFLICMSIVIEVIAGAGYVILSRFNFSEECVERTHSYLIFGLFLIAVSNVIISAFALDDHVCELDLMQKNEMDYIDQNPPNPNLPL